MKYSLRSLMIGVTLLCVASAIAGRSYYHHRMAVFHDNEVMRISAEDRVLVQDFVTSTIASAQHMERRKRYRQAVWRPWTIVDARPPEFDRTVLDLWAKKMEEQLERERLHNSSAPAPNPPKK